MGIFKFLAPESTVNGGCWCWISLCEMFPWPTWPLKNFSTIRRRIKKSYWKRAKFSYQLSYKGERVTLGDLGHTGNEVRGRISPPKLFPHDSNFLEDFLTNFQDSNLKGSKFRYFHPHEQSYFPKNPKHVILNFTSEALIVGRSK